MKKLLFGFFLVAAFMALPGLCLAQAPDPPPFDYNIDVKVYGEQNYSQTLSYGTFTASEEFNDVVLNQRNFTGFRNDVTFDTGLADPANCSFKVTQGTFNDKELSQAGGGIVTSLTSYDVLTTSANMYQSANVTVAGGVGVNAGITPVAYQAQAQTVTAAIDLSGVLLPNGITPNNYSSVYSGAQQSVVDYNAGTTGVNGPSPISP
jgi:hypothetical protein